MTTMSCYKQQSPRRTTIDSILFFNLFPRSYTIPPNTLLSYTSTVERRKSRDCKVDVVKKSLSKPWLLSSLYQDLSEAFLAEKDVAEPGSVQEE